MKLRSILVLLILFLGLMGSNVLVQGQDEDEYGKLTGWVLNPTTGTPVNEVFIISLFLHDKIKFPTLLLLATTDKRGYVSIEVSPGLYCLNIGPESLNSKYCIEPYPFYNEKFYFPVKIEPGKITAFRKKATVAGAIKINLKDISGRIINPIAELPNGGRVLISILSRSYTFDQLSSEFMTAGEMFIRRLAPTEYSLMVDFQLSGYKTLEYKNVMVKANEVTGIDCIIDINDTTGVEGKVFDSKGIPVKRIGVSVIPRFGISGDFCDNTDENGYYRITGLPEGNYYIMLFLRTKTENIEIKKGILLRKDIIKED